MRRAAVTLDVDGVRHYHAIHGLEAPSGGDPILERGVGRFLDLCERVGVSSTLFVVGADLDDAPFASLIKSAARAGHEIGSHSHTHRYDLSRVAPDVMKDDVERSVAAIARVATRPVGFRAPGYNVSEDLLDVVEAAGFTYDSSMMPSPLYFLARAAAIGFHGAFGAPSSSIVGEPRAFRAPRTPYRPRIGASYQAARSRVEGRGLVELPMATVLGVPWFGTAVTSLPTMVNGALAAWASLSSPVLELHGIDLCDVDDGFSPALARVQRDLRVPVKQKLNRLETVLRVLVQTSDVVTLDVMARAAFA